MEVEEEKVDTTSSTGGPGNNSHIPPEATQAPAPPSLWAQVPSSLQSSRREGL